MGDRRRLALLGSGVLLATLTGAVSPARAQPGDDPGAGDAAAADSDGATPAPVKDPKLARKWLNAGRQLVHRGDRLARQHKDDEAKAQFVNAVTALEKALAAGDDPDVGFELAEARQKAGDVAGAYHGLKALAAADSPASPDVRAKAKASLDAIAAAVGIVKLRIHPDGTQVTLGGNKVGDSPLPQSLVLAPGTYTLSMSAAGFEPKDVDLNVEAGSESVRTIELDPVPVVVKAPPPKKVVVVAPPSPQTPSPIPLYAGAAATAGLVVTATITGIGALRQHRTYVAPDTLAGDRAYARSHGRTLAHVTDACIVGAVAAAGFTAYWYLYRYRPAEQAGAEHASAEARAKVGVVPWVQPEAGGLSVLGAF